MKIGKEFWIGFSVGVLSVIILIFSGISYSYWDFKSEYNAINQKRNDHGEMIFDDFIDSSASQIFISSLPPMADIYIGNERVGKTNIQELKYKPGNYIMRFVKDSLQIEKEIKLKPGKNTSVLVRLK